MVIWCNLFARLYQIKSRSEQKQNITKNKYINRESKKEEESWNKEWYKFPKKVSTGLFYSLILNLSEIYPVYQDNLFYISVDVKIDDYLQNNPHKVEEYVIQNVSQDQLERWLIRKSKSSKQKCRANSGTLQLIFLKQYDIKVATSLTIWQQLYFKKNFSKTFS